MVDKKYHSFAEFYPFYLSQHQNKVCRQLHYLGSSIALLILLLSLITQQFYGILVAIIAGYLFAWIGHFFFEKNKPATFQYPFYSLLADWVMLWQAIFNRLRIES
jgi:hypothetical protein